MLNKFSRTLLIFVGLVLLSCACFGQWEVELVPSIVSDDYVLLTEPIDDNFTIFGTAVGASDGFDLVDIAIPPYPPGSSYIDNYFRVESTLVSRLSRDFRSVDADTIYWDYYFIYRGVGTVESYNISWDPDDLPAGDFRIGMNCDTIDVLHRTSDNEKEYNVDWDEAIVMTDESLLSIGFVENFIYHPVIRYVRSVGEISEADFPDELALSVYPNPFNAAVEITAPKGSSITIHDVTGKKIADFGVVENSITWSPAEEISTGIYFVRSVDGDVSTCRRMVYLK